MTFQSILIVGCGNMAGAMLEGWLAGGNDPARFTIADPSEPRFPAVEQHSSIPDSGSYDLVLLGVKPQMLGDVSEAIGKIAHAETIVLSVMAGVQLETLAEAFPDAGAVARVMTNLAVALGKAPVALVMQGMGEAKREELASFMEPLGTPEWVGEEQFDLVTALAGSGPAFVFRFIDALARAAEDLGLPADQADRLALAMVEGASALAAGAGESPGDLARRVASPGGTTQKGLDVLDEGEALAKLLADTLRSARDRGAELAAEARAKG